MKTCPFCAEEIQDSAVVCKHCGRDLKAKKQQVEKKKQGCASAGCLVILVLVLFSSLPGLLKRGDSPAAPTANRTKASTPTPAPPAPTPTPTLYYVNPGGDAFHDGGCKFVTDEAQPMVYAEAADGRRPCRTCRPPTPDELQRRADEERVERIEAKQAAIAAEREEAAKRAKAARLAAMPLVLKSGKGYAGEHGYHYVEGLVKNKSDSPIENLQAVATWYTSGGDFVTSDSALVEYDPLLPGQTSPFKVMTRSNPAMSKYTISFKRLMGGEIEAVDQRK